MEKVILELNAIDPFVDLSCSDYKLVISYENDDMILINGQRPIIYNNIVVQHNHELHLYSNRSNEIIPKQSEPENIITALILHYDNYRFVLLMRSTHNTILVLKREKEQEIQFQSVNNNAIITTDFMLTFNSVHGILFHNQHLYVYNGTMFLKCKATIQDYVQCFAAFRTHHQHHTVQGPGYSLWKCPFVSLVQFTPNNTLTIKCFDQTQVFQL
jgi:hypothetical protein